MPVALQSKVILDAFEVNLDLYQDVGIAGLHRLLGAVEKIIANDTSVIIAVAGQEGGLAPVLTGLVDIPIIGVPTSTGSGFGGEGNGVEQEGGGALGVLEGGDPGAAAREEVHHGGLQGEGPRCIV